MMTNRCLKEIIRRKTAWPSGLEIFGVVDWDTLLCCECMRTNYRKIARSRKHNLKDGWQVTGWRTTFYSDEHGWCRGCQRILHKAWI